MITTPLGFVDLFQLQPPQLVVHLFVLDVSHNAVEVGYLKYFSESLLKIHQDLVSPDVAAS